jgi:hypothetical protein
MLHVLLVFLQKSQREIRGHKLAIVISNVGEPCTNRRKRRLTPLSSAIM